MTDAESELVRRVMPAAKNGRTGTPRRYPVLEQVPAAQYPELLTIFADAGYQGRLEDIALDEHALELVIVPKLEGQNTFVVLPNR